MLPDAINAGFEFGMAVTIAVAVWRLWQARLVQGWSVWTVVWPTAWGCWNLVYYPHLGQRWSFYAGCAVVLANATWLVSVWWLRRGASMRHG